MSIQRKSIIERWALALAALLLGIVVGCTRTTTSFQLTVPAAQATPEAQSELPQDIEVLPIAIVNGDLEDDRYDLLAGQSRLLIATKGGPYVLAIDRLLQPTPVPAGAATEVRLTAPTPGQDKMTVSKAPSEPPTDTAIVSVTMPSRR